MGNFRAPEFTRPAGRRAGEHRERERTLDPVEGAGRASCPPGATVEWRGFPATAAFASALRQAIQSAAIDRMVCPDDTADIVLAASEAFANAVRHGTSGPGDAIWLSQQWRPEEVTIRLRYRGAPFEAGEPDLPDADRLQGRGRYIMRRLLDRVEYRFADGWTEVEMARRLRPARRVGAPG